MGSAGLSETAADGAGGSALGKRGSVASGAGRQPNRRSFPDHFLVETDPSSDPAIAEALGFEAQNDSVARGDVRSEEHTSELQSRLHLVCRLLLEKKKKPSLPSLHGVEVIDRLAVGRLA